MATARATKAEMNRILDVWEERGLPLAGMEILPDGTIRILGSGSL